MKTCETHKNSLLTMFVRYEPIDCTGRTIKPSLNSTYCLKISFWKIILWVNLLFRTSLCWFGLQSQQGKSIHLQFFFARFLHQGVKEWHYMALTARAITEKHAGFTCDMSNKIPPEPDARQWPPINNNFFFKRIIICSDNWLHICQTIFSLFMVF